MSVREPNYPDNLLLTVLRSVLNSTQGRGDDRLKHRIPIPGWRNLTMKHVYFFHFNKTRDERTYSVDGKVCSSNKRLKSSCLRTLGLVEWIYDTRGDISTFFLSTKSSVRENEFLVYS